MNKEEKIENHRKNMKRFSNFIKNLRETKNLSQKELADILKISLYRVENWENMKGRVTVSDIYNICKTFNISADLIFDWQ